MNLKDSARHAFLNTAQSAGSLSTAVLATCRKRSGSQNCSIRRWKLLSGPSWGSHKWTG